MLVIFNKDLSAEVVDSFSHEERKIYNMERDETNYKIKKGEIISPEIRAVYGILFFEKITLFLVCKYGRPDSFYIESSIFYKIHNDSASKYWKFYMDCNNENMIYPGVDFNNFRYIGIDRFVNEHDFFFKYHTDDQDALSYMQKMKLIIEEEAKIHLI